jgi:hypothetical protein
LRKKSSVAYFRTLSQHLLGGIEENNEKPQADQAFYGPKFKLGAL